MESLGIFSPNHSMGGQRRGIHIKDVSPILAEKTQWHTLKLQDPLYMHHSEGCAHSWLGHIQGSGYLRTVEMLRFKHPTERSDIGPHPPTYFQSGRKWYEDAEMESMDSEENRNTCCSWGCLWNLTVLNRLGLCSSAESMRLTAGFTLTHFTGLLFWNEVNT